MKNCNENLPEEYENDGNTYCHGVVNCKYYHDGCTFMSMGSGNPNDMPCTQQAEKELQEFREWEEERQKAFEKFLKERQNGLPENNWGKWIVSKVECPHCCECFNPNNYSKEELNRCPCCGTVMM